MTDFNQLGTAGMAALRSGDFAQARRHFEEIVALGGGDVAVWLAVALACKGQGDHSAELAAAGQVLAIDPNNVRANLIKGDAFVALGQKREAIGFYAFVLKLVPDLSILAPDVRREIERAYEVHATLTKELSDHLVASLQTAGFARGTSSQRFADSLDMILGTKKRYISEPRSYYFPELPAIEFYDRDLFPWMEELESKTGDIRDELLPLLSDEEAFAPYIEAEQQSQISSAGPIANHLTGKKDWSACYLMRDGLPVARNADRCPRTLAALNGVPFETIDQRAPFVLFSTLTPGAWIQPHTGFLNTRLVCHLPLIVPEGCWFRVGNTVRQWEIGKAWAFDDTIEHEARNEGSQTRTILIFNIWHPALTEEERYLVKTLQEATDSYQKA